MFALLPGLPALGVVAPPIPPPPKKEVTNKETPGRLVPS
jgi:hypothetical protein